jgi:hypothetical protein
MHKKQGTSRLLNNYERMFTMNASVKTVRCLISGMAVVFCFMSCQAEQPKAQNRPAGKAAAAELSPVAAAKTETAKAPVGKDNKIIVYYFHNSYRCPTCYMLENLAKSEVETSFADAIKNGKLEWKTVNVDDKGNEHFNDDYKLYTKSVIISTVKDGKELSWKNLDQIWQLVHEEDKYRKYIRDEVKACLGGKCL